MKGDKTISISAETWARLQAIATPFRGSELGTPDKVINRLLDEYEESDFRQYPEAERSEAQRFFFGS